MTRKPSSSSAATHTARLLLLLVLVGSHALVSACSTKKAGAGTTLALSPKDVMPLRDRDHYVYIWQRIVAGEREAEGLHVEHISALPGSNEYEVSVSEDGTIAGRLRFFHDGEHVALLSEDDVESGIRRTYEPPLVHLSAPLEFGESGMSSTATVTQIDDGTQIARVNISQRLRISEASDVVSALGNFDSGIVVEARRTVHTPNGDIELLSAALLVPGIGEIRSEGTTLSSDEIRPDGTPEIHTIMRRELACALIGTRTLGDCRAIDDAFGNLRSSSR